MTLSVYFVTSVVLCTTLLSLATDIHHTNITTENNPFSVPDVASAILSFSSNQLHDRTINRITYIIVPSLQEEIDQVKQIYKILQSLNIDPSSNISNLQSMTQRLIKQQSHVYFSKLPLIIRWICSRKFHTHQLSMIFKAMNLYPLRPKSTLMSLNDTLNGTKHLLISASRALLYWFSRYRSRNYVFYSLIHNIIFHSHHIFVFAVLYELLIVEFNDATCGEQQQMIEFGFIPWSLDTVHKLKMERLFEDFNWLSFTSRFASFIMSKRAVVNTLSGLEINIGLYQELFVQRYDVCEYLSNQELWHRVPGSVPVLLNSKWLLDLFALLNDERLIHLRKEIIKGMKKVRILYPSITKFIVATAFAHFKLKDNETFIKVMSLMADDMVFDASYLCCKWFDELRFNEVHQIFHNELIQDPEFDLFKQQSITILKQLKS